MEYCLIDDWFGLFCPSFAFLLQRRRLRRSVAPPTDVLHDETQLDLLFMRSREPVFKVGFVPLFEVF